MDISTVLRIAELYTRAESILRTTQPFPEFIAEQASAPWNVDELFEECSESIELCKECYGDLIKHWDAVFKYRHVDTPRPDFELIDEVLDDAIDTLLFNWLWLFVGNCSPDGGIPTGLIYPDDELIRMNNDGRERTNFRIIKYRAAFLAGVDDVHREVKEAAVMQR